MGWHGRLELDCRHDAGGMVGGDTLDIAPALAEASHLLITSSGAARGSNDCRWRRSPTAAARARTAWALDALPPRIWQT